MPVGKIPSQNGVDVTSGIHLSGSTAPSEGKYKGRTITPLPGQKYIKPSENRPQTRPIHLLLNGAKKLPPDKVDVFMPSLNAGSDQSHRPEPGTFDTPRTLARQNSTDSGFYDGDTTPDSPPPGPASIDKPAALSGDGIRQKDIHEKIDRYTSGVSSALVHVGTYKVKDIPSAVAAFTGYPAQSLETVFKELNLDDSWKMLCTSAIDLLKWAGEGEFPAVPQSLIQHARTHEQLDLKADKDYSRLLKKRTSKSLQAQASRSRAAANNYLTGPLREALNSYRDAVDAYIKMQPACEQLNKQHDFLNTELKEKHNLVVHSTITESVKSSWVRNLLIERAVNQSPLAGKDLL